MKYATGCRFSWIVKSDDKRVLNGIISLIVSIVSVYLIIGLISLVKVSEGCHFVGSDFWIFPWKIVASIFFHG